MALIDKTDTVLDCSAPLDLSVAVVSSHFQTYILPSQVSAALFQRAVEKLYACPVIRALYTSTSGVVF